jgi:hypothetical protein
MVVFRDCDKVHAQDVPDWKGKEPFFFATNSN